MSASDLTRPGAGVSLISAGASDLPYGVTRGLWAGTAGTANLTFADGTTATSFPILAGLNPFQVRAVTSTALTDLYAVY